MVVHVCIYRRYFWFYCSWRKWLIHKGHLAIYICSVYWYGVQKLFIFVIYFDKTFMLIRYQLSQLFSFNLCSYCKLAVFAVGFHVLYCLYDHRHMFTYLWHIHLFRIVMFSSLLLRLMLLPLTTMNRRNLNQLLNRWGDAHF